MLHGTSDDARPAARGWLLVLCGYLAMWQPFVFALVAAQSVPSIPIRGWMLGALLVVKLAVTAVGFAAARALYDRQPTAPALAGVALFLSAAMDFIVYTTSIVPNNRLPGTTPFYIAWSLVLHGSWVLYLLRSRRVRRTFG